MAEIKKINGMSIKDEIARNKIEDLEDRIEELEGNSNNGNNGGNGEGCGCDEHTHNNKDVLDGIDNEDIKNWDSATSHSLATHAPSNAEANVQSDWKETNTSSDAYIKNKPSIPAQPNFTYKINMISSNEEPSVITTGTYPNLVITFNIPQGIIPTEPGEEPKVEKMWIGYIPYDEAGAIGFNSLDQIGENITMKEIQFGLNASTMQELEPQTLGKTSIGIVPESCYICCICPKSKGYTVTMDNGIGGKIAFSDACGDYPINNQPLKIQIDGFEYLISGFLTNMEGERFLYID